MPTYTLAPGPAGIAPQLEISVKYIPAAVDLEADYTGNKLKPWKFEDGTNLECFS